jgi:hypothetical protein
MIDKKCWLAPTSVMASAMMPFFAVRAADKPADGRHVENISASNRIFGRHGNGERGVRTILQIEFSNRYQHVIVS